MKSVWYCLLLALISITPVAAEELTEQKKQLIDEMMTITGVANSTTLFARAFIDQYSNILKKTQPDIDPQAFAIIKDETLAVMREQVEKEGIIQKMYHPIYHKYLTEADLRELIAFYQTPVGQKMVTTMPLIVQESMLAGEQWGKNIGPLLQERLGKRLRQAGIAVSKDK